LEKDKNNKEPIILGIETSYKICGVSLAKGQNLLFEMNLNAYRSHIEKLYNLINDICKYTAINLNKIDLIAVSIGPGSYTGLRIGLSAAKGLAFSLGKPIIGIKTFEVLAFPFKDISESIFSIIPSKPGEFYRADFQSKDGVLSENGKANAISLDELYAELQTKKPGICGILEKLDLNYIEKSLGCRILGNGNSFPRSYLVSMLGCQKYIKKELSDLADLEPYYIKGFPDSDGS